MVKTYIVFIPNVCVKNFEFSFYLKVTAIKSNTAGVVFGYFQKYCLNWASDQTFDRPYEVEN